MGVGNCLGFRGTKLSNLVGLGTQAQPPAHATHTRARTYARPGCVLGAWRSQRALKKACKKQWNGGRQCLMSGPDGRPDQCYCHFHYHCRGWARRRQSRAWALAASWIRWINGDENNDEKWREGQKKKRGEPATTEVRAFREKTKSTERVLGRRLPATRQPKSEGAARRSELEPAK